VFATEREAACISWISPAGTVSRAIDPLETVEIRGCRTLLRHRINDRPTSACQGFRINFDAERKMTTTNEIADKIAGEHSLTKAQSKAIVEAVIASITEAAIAGNETSLPGFGKFKIKNTPEREARNPATGATIKVAAAKKLAFTPAKALKDALNK
jgi:DNA-binding protein HU-beta